MGDDYRRYHDSCDRMDDCMACDPCETYCDKEDEWDWGSWLPILVIVLILTGGFGLFRGGGGRNDCDGGGGEGGISWILIIVVIILLFSQGGDGKKGGFLGGLF